MTTQPAEMVIFNALTLLIFIAMIKFTNKRITLTNNENKMLEIALLFGITFFLISFSAWEGPRFFQSMNYTISDNNTITTFEATSCFTSSVLAVVIGYIFTKIT